MSITVVQSILDEAALRFGDPNKTHFDNGRLLGHYNDATEDITTRWQMLEADADFSWKANEDRYAYPADCVQMLRLQYNPTAIDATTGPTDQNQWRKTKEITEWEYTRITDGLKPPGDFKLYYWPRTGFLVTYPVPTVALYLAGRIGYWKRADLQVTAITRMDLSGNAYSASTTELSDSLRRMIRDRMQIGMKLAQSRHEEALVDMQVWEAAMDKLGPRIEQPVDDRREHFRPALPTESQGGWLDADPRAV